jgi:phosphatidylethanolamine-binding protein (PEBP) family uncharacterized protein
MGRLLNMAVGAALMGVTLAFAGCGGSSSTSQSSTPSSASQTTSAAGGTQTSGAPSGASGNEQASKTSEPPEHLPKVSILLSSPVFQAGGPIPAQYTCDGADSSPPLRWSAIPRGTAELVLFVVNANSQPGGQFQFSWAVAGLHPTLKGISAGKLPPGAIVGRNSLGQSRYTICPSKSEGPQQYAVILLTAQHSVSAKPGFNANALYKSVSSTAEYKGLTGFAYQRR